MIRPITLSWKKEPEELLPYGEIRFFRAEVGLGVDLVMPKGISAIYGFDAGQVNSGFCVLKKDHAVLVQVKAPSVLNPVDRMRSAKDIVLWMKANAPKAYAAGVEYSSFGSPFGQTALAENRIITAHDFIQILGVPEDRVVFAAPKKIRKEIFGSGNVKAEEFWPLLEKFDHAAAALSCAFYAKLVLQEVLGG